MYRIYSFKNLKFIFHRISGLILLLYFIFHILSISTALLFGKETFDSVMGLFDSSFFYFVEISIVILLVGHGLNGLYSIATERNWIRG